MENYETAVARPFHDLVPDQHLKAACLHNDVRPELVGVTSEGFGGARHGRAATVRVVVALNTLYEVLADDEQLDGDDFARTFGLELIDSYLKDRDLLEAVGEAAVEAATEVAIERRFSHPSPDDCPFI